MNFQEYDRLVIDFQHSVAKSYLVIPKSTFINRHQVRQEMFEKLDDYFDLLHNTIFPSLLTQIDSKINFLIHVFFDKSSDFQEAFNLLAPENFWRSQDGEQKFNKILDLFSVAASRKFTSKDNYYDQNLEKTIISFFQTTSILLNNPSLPPALTENNKDVFIKIAQLIKQNMQEKIKDKKTLEVNGQRLFESFIKIEKSFQTRIHNKTLKENIHNMIISLSPTEIKAAQEQGDFVEIENHNHLKLKI